MILTAANTDTGIMDNIVTTLQQLKDGVTANQPLILPPSNGASVGFDNLNSANFDSMADALFDGLNSTNNTLTFANLGDGQFADMSGQSLGTLDTTYATSVTFFNDPARLNVFFNDSPTVSPASFVQKGVYTLYTPSTSLLNGSTTLSNTDCQPVYYVTAYYPDGSEIYLTYNNLQNLLFSSVIVSSKKDPKFTVNAPQAIVVPAGEKPDFSRTTSNLGFMIVDFDVYIQLPIFNWSKLSEQQRLTAGNNVNNLIRLGLSADRYRDGNATLYNANINGTYVGQIKVTPSDAMLKGVIRVQCAYNVASTSY